MTMNMNMSMMNMGLPNIKVESLKKTEVQQEGSNTINQ